MRRPCLVWIASLATACATAQPAWELAEFNPSCGEAGPAVGASLEAAWAPTQDSLLVRVRVRGQSGPVRFGSAFGWLDSLWEQRSHVDTEGRLALRSDRAGDHLLHLGGLGWQPVDVRVRVPLPADSVVVAELRSGGDLGCAATFTVPVRRR